MKFTLYIFYFYVIDPVANLLWIKFSFDLVLFLNEYHKSVYW